MLDSRNDDVSRLPIEVDAKLKAFTETQFHRIANDMVGVVFPL